MASEITGGVISNAFEGFLKALEELNIPYELQPSGFNRPSIAYFRRGNTEMVAEWYVRQDYFKGPEMALAVYEFGKRPKELEYEGRRPTILQYPEP